MAQEHAATAVVESELAMLAFDHDVEPTTGRIVVACVEGEWHSLPARMASELLRLRGWDVTFLGPSVPADDLAARVRQLAPDAVGLSCSVPLFLKGANRSIVACRAVGVPVVAGGTGFGDEGRYAIRLGADGWTADPRLTPAIVGGRAGGGPRPAPDGEHLLLEAVRPDLVARAVSALGGGEAAAVAPTVTEVHAALDALVTSVECACLVDDGQVVTACIPFIERLLPSALAARTSVPDLLCRLVPDVRRHSVRAARLTEAALRSLGRP